jgi:hypothetical protein
MNDERRDPAASLGSLLPVGSYVLATKWEDGDPGEHFFVGFVSGYTRHGRYLIADGAGKIQRANGFRRAEKITADEGAALVAMIPRISDRSGQSLWWHLARIRGTEKCLLAPEVFDWV